MLLQNEFVGVRLKHFQRRALQVTAQIEEMGRPIRGATAPPPDLTTYWRARYPKYQLAPHIRLMLDALNDLRDAQALIITMPPRHAKSISVNAWLEWSLGQSPEAEAILASYSIDLARRHSRSIRNEIAFGTAFRGAFPGVQLAPDSAAATDWALTAGGRFKAAGVNVGITGMGARFAAIDDPVKDRASAESQMIREGTWEWFTSAFLTRLTPDARVVLCTTRWHPDDLAGRILKLLGANDSDDLGGLSWQHLNLTAIYDDPQQPDPLGRELGAALWPERYSLTRLEGVREVNPYDFEALYQQRPRKRGGSVFSDSPARYDTPVISGARVVISLDTASSQRQTADYTVFTVMAGTGHGPETHADVLEVRRGRFDLTQSGAVALELQERYGSQIVIEETSQSLPIIQYYRTLGLQVKGQRPVGDKFTRAQPYAAAWNGGRVRLPLNAPWVGPHLGEHAAFTGTSADENDDAVDSGAYGFNELTRPVVDRPDFDLDGFSGYA